MNNSRESEAIYQIYQEGIFDRVGARIKGIGNTKFFGGTGYNAGKAESFKGKFYARIIKDIDKFLKEVQTMGNVRSLADFEQQYPDIAMKIACMADAVGHTTQLTVKCGGEKPDKIEPDKIEPDKIEPDPPKPGLKKGYICVKGVCKSIPVKDTNGKLTAPNIRNKIYRTAAECRAKCAKPQKPDHSDTLRKKLNLTELEDNGSDSKKSKEKKIMKETINIILKIVGDGNNVNVNLGDQESVDQIINNDEVRRGVSSSIKNSGYRGTKSNINKVIKNAINKISQKDMAKTRKKTQSMSRYIP